jgi:hypothetical protein
METVAVVVGVSAAGEGCCEGGNDGGTGMVVIVGTAKGPQAGTTSSSTSTTGKRLRLFIDGLHHYFEVT